MLVSPGGTNLDEGIRERLVSSARPLFAEKGFSGTSVREIATRAGVNQASVSYYFGGKEGLYRAVLESLWQEVDRHFSVLSLEGLPPMERIESFVRGFFSLHAANPALVRFLNRELADPTSCFETVLIPRVRKVAGLLREAIVQAKEEGKVKEGVDPEAAAILLASMSNYVFLVGPLARRIFLGLEKVPESLPDLILEMFRNGVSIHEA
jgi:TetR/AcrR family transcriptional regulator